ncbi:hypothetical protein MANES_12G119603v8 [Manihot esculenta]|uniref:Uncharacterized protein n=1 Tax=Manihot esculenta TaxID=3983 RepID=A0ACB7GS29_MANES|nr:hypothetical protein MANES_12G119603v8 [Manihot esculenta]
MKQSFCQLVEVVLSFSNDTVMSISRSCKLVIQHYFLRFAPQLCLYNSTSLFASVGELVVGPAYVPLNYKGNCSMDIIYCEYTYILNPCGPGPGNSLLNYKFH